MSVADNTKKVGEIITYIGIAGVFAMLVVGTIAIDIVILAALLENSKKHKRSYDSFVTGWLFGMMFSSHNNRGLYSNAGISLALSPITTGIAIALSFFLGVPAVGIGLALGWAAVAAVVGLGLLIYGIGELVEQYNTQANNTMPAADFSEHGHPYSCRNNFLEPLLRQEHNNLANDTTAQTDAPYGQFVDPRYPSETIYPPAPPPPPFIPYFMTERGNDHEYFEPAAVAPPAYTAMNPLVSQYRGHFLSSAQPPTYQEQPMSSCSNV